MNSSSAQILAELIDPLRRGEKGGNLRGELLLKSAGVDFPKNWSMAIRSCFDDALDIKGVDGAWTQGSMFSFKAGDMLYDCAEAYILPWGEALSFLGLGVEVVSARPATWVKSEDGKRWLRLPGFVKVKIFVLAKDAKSLIFKEEKFMTQDEFVFFLIHGSRVTSPDEEMLFDFGGAIGCH